MNLLFPIFASDDDIGTSLNKHNLSLSEFFDYLLRKLIFLGFIRHFYEILTGLVGGEGIGNYFQLYNNERPHQALA